MSGTSAGWLLVLPARLELLHIKGRWQVGTSPRRRGEGFLNLSAPIRILRRDPGDTGTGHGLATWSWSRGWSSWTQHGHGVPGCTAPRVASGHHQGHHHGHPTAPLAAPGLGGSCRRSQAAPKPRAHGWEPVPALPQALSQAALASPRLSAPRGERSARQNNPGARRGTQPEEDGEDQGRVPPLPCLLPQFPFPEHTPVMVPAHHRGVGGRGKPCRGTQPGCHQHRAEERSQAGLEAQMSAPAVPLPGSGAVWQADRAGAPRLQQGLRAAPRGPPSLALAPGCSPALPVPPRHTRSVPAGNLLTALPWSRKIPPECNVWAKITLPNPPYPTGGLGKDPPAPQPLFSQPQALGSDLSGAEPPLPPHPQVQDETSGTRTAPLPPAPPPRQGPPALCVTVQGGLEQGALTCILTERPHGDHRVHGGERGASPRASPARAQHHPPPCVAPDPSTHGMGLRGREERSWGWAGSSPSRPGELRAALGLVWARAGREPYAAHRDEEVAAGKEGSARKGLGLAPQG